MCIILSLMHMGYLIRVWDVPISVCANTINDESLEGPKFGEFGEL